MKWPERDKKIKWCGNCKYFINDEETGRIIYGYCKSHECKLIDNKKINIFNGCEAFAYNK